MSLESREGQQLYELLPAVFRNRDNNEFSSDGSISVDGDMARLLDAHGALLDLLKATLDQRLADCFPDTPIDGGPVCQDWLLPYFADLLDVRLVSPDAAGQREEIAHAIAWRKGKGTLHVVEQIVESLSGMEAELQEGWRRVAMTPVIGMPMRPDPASGRNLDKTASGDVVSAIGSRYPGLPAATLDMRRASRTLQTGPGDPLAKGSRFADAATTYWMHANPHGVPCFTGSYEDVSRRTVDIRTPDHQQGHAHPDRLLIYVPPFGGMFDGDVVNVSWLQRDNPASAFAQWIEVDKSDTEKTVYRNKSMGSDGFRPVRIRRVIELGKQEEGDPDAHIWRFEGLILENAVLLHGGRLELESCAARKIEVHSVDIVRPLLSARHTLFNTLENPRGLSRLEYCTVLHRTVSETIEASDCIFAGLIQKDRPTTAPPAGGCIRYSRVHPKQAGGGASIFRASVSRDYLHMFSGTFGKPGCGVLSLESHASIRSGAEDGGEMGAYHDRRYCQRWRAVLDKLADYLPLGLEAVLVPDVRLTCKPPEQE